MAETLTALTTPLVMRVNAQNQVANSLSGEPTAFTRLAFVREVREDATGATLHFQEGITARVARDKMNYATYLRLAQRSLERRQPVGVRFDEASAVLELIRADNDVATQLWDEEPGGARVLFQGHDGVFRIRADRPESAHLRNLLSEAIRLKVPIWFIAQKPDLTLLDILPCEGMRELQISFVVAPEHLLRTADEILRARIRCSKTLRRDIRAVAKAYIDEADELKRGVREVQTNASIAQITCLSPTEMIDKAKRLHTIQLSNKELQEKVRNVANSYVLVAEKNQQFFDAFKQKYRDGLPATK